MDHSLLSSVPATRKDDVVVKHSRVVEFLEDEQYDAVLLMQTPGFAWYTGGADNSLGIGQGTCAALFVTADEAVLVAQEPHTLRITKEQLGTLEFEIHSIPWDEPLELACQQMCQDRRVASDWSLPGATLEAAKLARLRVDLTPLETLRYRDIGRAVAHAVEATARSVERGASEAEVAGELAHRLLKRQLQPVEIYVAADDRTERFGRPTPSNLPIQRRCWISAVARHGGLCAGTSRTVCFGEVEKSFIKDYKLGSMVCGACIYYAQPGRSAKQVLDKVVHCYEQMARTEEFYRAEPGCVTGYRPCELPLRSDSTYELGDPIALLWRPMVGAAPSCDTVLVDSTGYEIVTGLQKWPQLQVEVGGHQIERPDLLIRD